MSRVHVGFMYVAKKECGRVAALCWDDAKYKKDTAKTVADYIKRGLTVERLERFECGRAAAAGTLPAICTNFPQQQPQVNPNTRVGSLP